MSFQERTEHKVKEKDSTNHKGFPTNFYFGEVIGISRFNSTM
jgi:hypothetical protein